MKAPPKRKGNLRWLVRACSANLTLNESPSEKEGKSVSTGSNPLRRTPSMKVPPKRKGNGARCLRGDAYLVALNESPSEKEGKLRFFLWRKRRIRTLNESPSEKEGKSEAFAGFGEDGVAPQ